ncbi:MAG: hypothetical protein DRP67_02750 [Candidatus Omnitrophota bacterium]|nr:MAG: hypothetical protein DRP67_02750 [Candidatus Omnitrophota bacterium]
MDRTCIFGYSGSGKTTLFKKLTGKEEEIFDPFKPNIGIGIFRDKRLEKIAEILKIKKVKFPEFEFWDLKGFPESEGFPPQYFENLYKADLLLCVVKNFKDGLNPEDEISSLIMELTFHDIERIENIIKKNEKDIPEKTLKVLEKSLKILKEEKLLGELSEDEKKEISGFQLLTLKKILVFINGDKGEVENLKIPFIYGDSENPDFEIFYRKILETLSCIIFYTIKGDIAQGWIINKNLQARKAAGKIHTDIEKGFIKAAVLKYKDFLEIGSFQKAKNMGMLKFLGPDSTLSDGDIVEFYFHR